MEVGAVVVAAVGNAVGVVAETVVGISVRTERRVGDGELLRKVVGETVVGDGVLPDNEVEKIVGEPVGKLAGKLVGDGELLEKVVGETVVGDGVLPGNEVEKIVGEPVGKLAGKPVGILAENPVGESVSSSSYKASHAQLPPSITSS